MVTHDNEHNFDFTLAPVQGFVGQARRTRDFWAGSYLISYLSAHAMAAVERCGGKVTFPFVDDDPLMMAVSGVVVPTSRRDVGASVASLPNRFSAQCPDAVQCGNAAVAAVQTEWHRLALGVWQAVRLKLLHFISDPQRLPELAYADTLPPVWERQVSKHWETYWVADGGNAGIDQRKNWRHVHLFSEQGEVCTVCGERVACLGAGMARQTARALWDLSDGSVLDALNYSGDHWDLALDEDGKERLCAVCMVKRVLPYVGKDVIGWDLPMNFMSTHDLAGRPASTDDDDMDPPYYAVLVMDGDHLGRVLSAYPERRASISRAISHFSRAAPGIIEGESRGVSVYSGGDDVLALLPVGNALPCANKLRALFSKECSKAGVEMKISASILCTHAKSPMQAALRTAQRLLASVAKDALGRDAFVIQVQKRSGSPLTLAKKWGECGEVADTLLDLSDRVFSGGERSYSSRFLYNIASLLEPFAVARGNEHDMSGIDVVPILAAEYLRGPAALQGIDWAEAQRRMAELYDICRWDGPTQGGRGERILQPEGFPLLRLLAEAKEAMQS